MNAPDHTKSVANEGSAEGRASFVRYLPRRRIGAIVRPDRISCRVARRAGGVDVAAAFIFSSVLQQVGRARGGCVQRLSLTFVPAHRSILFLSPSERAVRVRE